MSDPSSPPPIEPSTARSMFGGLLIAVGLLIAILCGLCTGFFQIGFLYDFFKGNHSGGELQFPTLLPLMLGTVPILVGIGLFMWGRWLLRTR